MHPSKTRTLAVAAALLLGGCGGEQRPAPSPDAPAAGAPAPAQPSAATMADLERLGYRRGSPDAPVTVIEFSDFGCPYCARFALQTLPELDGEFIERGQVQWLYVPFVLGMFPNGEQAALTAECAGEQERFWPMHDLLYERQREWKGSSDADPLFLRYARDVGLDLQRFRRCYAEAAPAARIAQANAAAQELGVRATPNFFVNGHRVEGALPLDQFRMLLQWSGAGTE